MKRAGDLSLKAGGVCVARPATGPAGNPARMDQAKAQQQVLLWKSRLSKVQQDNVLLRASVKTLKEQLQSSTNSSCEVETTSTIRGRGFLDVPLGGCPEVRKTLKRQRERTAELEAEIMRLTAIEVIKKIFTVIFGQAVQYKIILHF